MGRVRKRREAEEKKEEPLERREGGGKGKRARRQRPTARKVARKKPTARMSCGKPAPKMVIPEGMNVEYFWARELKKDGANWMREERTREEAENIEKERKRKGLEPRTEAEILEHESKIQDEPIRLRLLVEWMEEGEKKEKWELL